MIKHLPKFSLLLMAGLWLGSGNESQAQVNLTAAGYTQNFDGMGATGTALPTGWSAMRLAGSGTANQVLSPVVTDGAASSGAVFNVGTTTAAERALGSLSSASTMPAYGIKFKNTSGATKSGLRIEAVMEQWRSGSNATVNEKVVFEYSTNATDLSTGTWIGVESLDLVEILTSTTAAAAINGNTAANQTAISGTVNVSLAADAEIFIRWRDVDDFGSDGIYSIDDLSVNFAGAADATAPSLGATPFMPADNATGVATTTDLTVTFDEAVKLGTGAFTLYNLSDNTNAALTAGVSGSTITLTSASALLPGKNYAIQIATGAVTDMAGNAFAGITDNTTWNFSTASTASPVINASVSSLTFGATAQNKFSAVQSYALSTSDLSGNVTVAVTGSFQIAKGTDAAQGAYGTTALTFTPADITAGEKVFVRYAPTATGASTGSVTHNATGAQEVTVALAGAAYNPYVQNFNDPAFLTNSGWSQFSVTGAQVWASTNFGQTCLSGCSATTVDKAAQINGFASGNNANEDWLISPSMDLASFTNFPVLEFASISAFEGNQLKLMYSTNYTGTGNPNDATWTEIPGVFPASNSSVWTMAEGIQLPKNANVHVAFVYTSTTEAASRWTVDNFMVEDATSFYQIPTTVFSFGEVAPNATSAPQNFTFKAVGSGNVTVTAPTGFKVATTATGTYAQSVEIAAEAASNGQTIYVTYTPTTKVISQKGQIAITATGLDVKTITVEGSSYFKSETFEVTSFNMEFFATDIRDNTGFEYGPTNDELQVANATRVMQTIKSDIFAVQEVVDEPELAKVVAAMPGYAKNISPVYSFSIRQSSSTEPFPAQKVGFVYNTATVTPVGFRVMFEKMYRETVAGSTTTGIDAGFWSSGRLPYMGIFDVVVAGKTERVHVVNVHAKAGSASGDYTDRLFDVKVLSDSLKAHYGNVNLILLGDFNDDVSKSTRGASFVTTFNPIVSDVQSYKTLTFELSQAGAVSHPTTSGGNFLDHIIISNELVSQYIDNSIVIEDPRTYVSGYISNTSDHLPVTARFALTTILGVKDALSRTFGVYPNPTVGKITLQLPANVAKQPKLNLTLYTTRGSVILRTTGTEQSLSQELSRVLQKSAAGLYLIKIQAGTESYQARVIKN